MTDPRVAPKGQYRVICDANFGGSTGSSFVGDFASLAEAKKSCRPGNEGVSLTYRIYDDQGKEVP